MSSFLINSKIEFLVKPSLTFGIIKAFNCGPESLSYALT